MNKSNPELPTPDTFDSRLEEIRVQLRRLEEAAMAEKQKLRELIPRGDRQRLEARRQASKRHRWVIRSSQEENKD